MSNTPSPAPSRSNLDSVFSSAFQAYKKKTGKDITSHPLAIELQSCHSPHAILAVLRNQIHVFGQSHNADEKFAKWLIPTVNVLFAFSATLGEGVGLVGIMMSSLLKIRPKTPVSGILASKSSLCWNRRSPPGLSLLVLHSVSCLTPKFSRRLEMSVLTRTHSSICSIASNFSSAGSRFTPTFHLLRL